MAKFVKRGFLLDAERIDKRAEATAKAYIKADIKGAGKEAFRRIRDQWKDLAKLGRKFAKAADKEAGDLTKIISRWKTRPGKTSYKIPKGMKRGKEFARKFPDKQYRYLRPRGKRTLVNVSKTDVNKARKKAGLTPKKK